MNNPTPFQRGIIAVQNAVKELSQSLAQLSQGLNGPATPEQNEVSSFDLFRLTKSKKIVDISCNTLRTYNKKGLPFYKSGGSVFVSKSELEHFIRNPEAFSKNKK